MTGLPPCALCGTPVRLVVGAAGSRAGQVWLHVERPVWMGDYYDHRAHNAVPMVSS